MDRGIHESKQRDLEFTVLSIFSTEDKALIDQKQEKTKSLLFKQNLQAILYMWRAVRY